MVSRISAMAVDLAKLGACSVAHTTDLSSTVQVKSFWEVSFVICLFCSIRLIMNYPSALFLTIENAMCSHAIQAFWMTVLQAGGT